jgi:hypothetical protein
MSILKQSKPGVNGKPRSKSLFEDGTYDIDLFHKRFIELEDLTEYKPAMELVKSWQEWNRLGRDWPDFRSYVKQWKDELETKLKAEALQKVLTFSRGDDQKALTASKFIATKDYNREAGVGRPTKAQQRREAKELSKDLSETKAESKRINDALKLVKGG